MPGYVVSTYRNRRSYWPKNNHSWLKRLGLVLLYLLIAVAIASLLYIFILRPWHMNWGSTSAEVRETMPGDDLVPNPIISTTRSITIKAPADLVWQWIVQIGYKRAGFYNYDFINNLFGQADYVDGHKSAKRIVPELQNLQVGETLYLHSQASFKVQAIDPGKSLILSNRVDVKTGQPFELGSPTPAEYLNNSWVFYLKAVDSNTTRLISRQRYDFHSKTIGMGLYGIEPGAFLQERAMLKGIKNRAEHSSGK